MHILFGNKEEHLARRLRDGDSEALKDFYTLYADYLTGVCARYITNDEDLKDVFQDSLTSYPISRTSNTEAQAPFKHGAGRLQ